MITFESLDVQSLFSHVQYISGVCWWEIVVALDLMDSPAPGLVLFGQHFDLWLGT